MSNLQTMAVSEILKEVRELCQKAKQEYTKTISVAELAGKIAKSWVTTNSQTRKKSLGLRANKVKNYAARTAMLANEYANQIEQYLVLSVMPQSDEIYWDIVDIHEQAKNYAYGANNTAQIALEVLCRIS